MHLNTSAATPSRTGGRSMAGVNTPTPVVSCCYAMEEAHASNRHVFKEALQDLAQRHGLEIRIAHYPPYGSKHKPIEHRLFAHVTRACQGLIFHTVDIAKKFMAKTKPSTGLKVSVDVLSGVCAAGKKCAADFLATMRIRFDKYLPRWNYRAAPLGR